MSIHRQNTNCRVFLIDASIYIFRAWYIYPETITDQENRPINALYGFLYFLSDFLNNVSPEHIAIAFDGNTKVNYRKELYPAYKANREPAPEELKHQFGLCMDVAEKLGFRCMQSDYYEADDLIATLAARYKELDFGVTVVSADKDLAQIMEDEHDYLWDFARDEVYDAQRIAEKFGVMPNKIPELLALAGDKVDNIPGANGVGVKTAAKLLSKFSSLEELLASPDRFKQYKIRNSTQIGEAIYNDVEQIKLFHKLTVLANRADIDESTSCQWSCPKADMIDEILMEYNVDNILRSRFLRIAPS